MKTSERPELCSSFWPVNHCKSQAGSKDTQAESTSNATASTSLAIVAVERFHYLSRWASISRYLHFQSLQLLPSWHGGMVLTFSVHLSRREVGTPISVSPLFLLHNHIGLSSRIRSLKSFYNNLCKVARKPCCCLHFTSNKLKACLWFFFFFLTTQQQQQHSLSM